MALQNSLSIFPKLQTEPAPLQLWPIQDQLQRQWQRAERRRSRGRHREYNEIPPQKSPTAMGWESQLSKAPALPAFHSKHSPAIASIGNGLSACWFPPRNE